MNSNIALEKTVLPYYIWIVTFHMKSNIAHSVGIIRCSWYLAQMSTCNRPVIYSTWHVTLLLFWKIMSRFPGIASEPVWLGGDGCKVCVCVCVDLWPVTQQCVGGQSLRDRVYLICSEDTQAPAAGGAAGSWAGDCVCVCVCVCVDTCSM